jgi:hypothetical protein
MCNTIDTTIYWYMLNQIIHLEHRKIKNTLYHISVCFSTLRKIQDYKVISSSVSVCLCVCVCVCMFVCLFVCVRHFHIRSS